MPRAVADQPPQRPGQADSTFRETWQRDCETLRAVLSGLSQLEGRWAEARVSVSARQRGYFTPDEDDWVRQMLLCYRNYRIALYGIIEHYQDYHAIEPRSDQLHGVLVGLAAALTLYSNSLKLIQTYEREPLVRNKLNEPDSRFELEAGFFDTILRAYSSPGKYRELIKAIWFWQANRREIQRLAAEPDCHWLIRLVRRERTVVRQRLTKILLCRLRYDWRAFRQTALRPVLRTRYGMQSWIGGACAGLRTSGQYDPALSPETLAALRPLLHAGDVLLVRAEGKLTAALLPGFWAHSAIYLGDRSDLEALGLNSHRQVVKHAADVDRTAQPYGSVIEAVSPRVQINRLDRCLHADHVAVLRPNLRESEIRAAVAEAFGHLGKPYDFEFDFNISTRLVCTELVYRCYHRRGCIQFPLTKRLGRFTLSADDIAAAALGSASEGQPAPFQSVCLLLKIGEGPARFVASAETLSTLRRLQEGWRPARSTEASHA